MKIKKKTETINSHSPPTTKNHPQTPLKQNLQRTTPHLNKTLRYIVKGMFDISTFYGDKGRNH